jgi:hypothetical protein
MFMSLIDLDVKIFKLIYTFNNKLTVLIIN